MPLCRAKEVQCREVWGLIICLSAFIHRTIWLTIHLHRNQLLSSHWSQIFLGKVGTSSPIIKYSFIDMVSLMPIWDAGGVPDPPWCQTCQVGPGSREQGRRVFKSFAVCFHVFSKCPYVIVLIYEENLARKIIHDLQGIRWWGNKTRSMSKE